MGTNKDSWAALDALLRERLRAMDDLDRTPRGTPAYRRAAEHYDRADAAHRAAVLGLPDAERESYRDALAARCAP